MASVTFAWPHKAGERRFFAAVSARPASLEAQRLYEAHARTTHYWPFPKLAASIGDCLVGREGLRTIELVSDERTYTARFFDEISRREIDLAASEQACDAWSQADGALDPGEDCLSIVVRKGERVTGSQSGDAR